MKFLEKLLNKHGYFRAKNNNPEYLDYEMGIMRCSWATIAAQDSISVLFNDKKKELEIHVSGVQPDLKKGKPNFRTVLFTKVKVGTICNIKGTRYKLTKDITFYENNPGLSIYPITDSKNNLLYYNLVFRTNSVYKIK